MSGKQLILASASPRRKELLDQIGVHYRVQPADICEDVILGETPEDYVSRMALEKAEKVYDLAASERHILVLGSDTSVVCDGRILGKPVDKQDGCAMLMALSGRSHYVMTAIALVGNGLQEVRCVTTEVKFRSLSETEVVDYWATNEPVDKAGGYGIQGMGAVFVEQISGSYSAVVGLPLAETAALLKAQGLPIWHS